VLFVVLALATLVLHQIRVLQPLEDLAASLLAPVQRGLSQGLFNVSRISQGFQDATELQKRNAALQKQVDELIVENVQLRERAAENAALRDMLGFRQVKPALAPLGAEVIGRDPSNLLSYLILDHGAADGVARGMPVITVRGLVGQITEVSPRTAKVLLITDVSSSVSALVQESRATGVVQGQLGGRLIMRYIPQTQKVEVGNVILTSGLGGKFPKGIVIGQVTAVHQRDVELFQEAEIRPSVDFHALEMVLVVQSFVPVDSAPARP